MLEGTSICATGTRVDCVKLKDIMIPTIQTRADVRTLWSNQFLAKANQKGYRGIVEGTESVPGDAITLDETSDADKKKSKLREANKAGYSDLIALMGKSKMALLTVSKARSTALPYGDLRLAWKNLKERYQPSDDQTAQEVIEAYNNCTLEAHLVAP